jgi:hypothetical protein
MAPALDRSRKFASDRPFQQQLNARQYVWFCTPAYIERQATAGRAAVRACTHKFAMSALPPKADIAEHDRNVRFVPIADIMRCRKTLVLFDHLVGSHQE